VRKQERPVVRPIVTFSKALGKHHLDLNARWVHEFENIKRIEGNLFMLSATFKF